MTSTFMLTSALRRFYKTDIEYVIILKISDKVKTWLIIKNHPVK